MIEYYRFKVVNDLFLKGMSEEAKEELATLQRKYVALCEENINCKIQLQEFEDILFLSKNLSLNNGFYWLNTGSFKQGPFCPFCYDNQGMLTKLAPDANEFYCPFCSATFTKPETINKEVGHPIELGKVEQGAGRANKAIVIPIRKI